MNVAIQPSPPSTRMHLFGRVWSWLRWSLCERPIEIAPAEQTDSPQAPRAAAVLACAAIHQGEWTLAESAIAALVGVESADARCLNLLGVIAEARGEWKRAWRLYGRAIAADRCYRPAQQNMRRLYELHTFGDSREAIALDDDGDALRSLLAQTRSGGCPSRARHKMGDW
jgi:hypothetical protein